MTNADIKRKIQEWIAIIDKDIKANERLDKRVEEKHLNDGSQEYSYYRIAYSPENVKRMLEGLIND